jgi:hypothetical protein
LIVWKLGGRNGQYSTEDTGFPELAPFPDAISPIDDGKEHNNDDYVTTLELVIDSVLKNK